MQARERRLGGRRLHLFLGESLLEVQVVLISAGRVYKQRMLRFLSDNMNLVRGIYRDIYEVTGTHAMSLATHRPCNLSGQNVEGLSMPLMKVQRDAHAGVPQLILKC